jgi:serine/threonine protein kinase
VSHNRASLHPSTHLYSSRSHLNYYRAFPPITISDLKPQNIGFDVRGHVKVFDFGLAKPLDPEHEVAGGLYNMTGMCGSVPYVAPEVALMRPYNEKCDVFSFGVLLYGILALRAPFPYVKTRSDFITKVAERGGRPGIKKSWPSSSKLVLQGCFSAEPHNRPTMEMIRNKISDDVVGLTNGDMVRARAEQFMNISLHSLYNVSKELTLEKSSHPPAFVTTS